MASRTLTINFTPPPGVHSYIVKYRVAGSGSPYSQVYPNPTSAPVVIPGLADGVDYEGTIQTICTDGPSTGIAWTARHLGCLCTSGYTASPDGSYCYKELTEAAAVGGGGTITACHFTFNTYNDLGTAFYQPGGYNLNGTYTIAPTFLKTPLAGGSYTGSLWGNHVPNTTDGRVNRAFIWKCGDPNYLTTPLGFTRQIIIPTTKTYYIGCAGDNKVTIKINGITIVDQDPTAISAQTLMPATDARGPFEYWHVYPVVLNSGINLLEVTGTNLPGGTSNPGGMGCEIYNATEAQLISCITEADLVPYIVFTTANILSLPAGTKVTDGDPFEVGSYNCDAHPGYTLIYDVATTAYICKKIDTLTCI